MGLDFDRSVDAGIGELDNVGAVRSVDVDDRLAQSNNFPMTAGSTASARTKQSSSVEWRYCKSGEVRGIESWRSTSSRISDRSACVIVA